MANKNVLPAGDQPGVYNGYRTILTIAPNGDSIVKYDEGPEEGQVCKDQTVEQQGLDIARKAREMFGEEKFQKMVETAPEGIVRFCESSGISLEAVVGYLQMGVAAGDVDATLTSLQLSRM